jgi:hypothetical protein
MRFVFFLLLFVPETSVKNVETQRDGPAETACILKNHLDVLNGAAMEGLPMRESGFKSRGFSEDHHQAFSHSTRTRKSTCRKSAQEQASGSA